MIEINNCFYLFGGCKWPKQGVLDDMWRYDKAKNDWEKLVLVNKDIPNDKISKKFAFACCKDKFDNIFIYGGFCFVTATEVSSRVFLLASPRKGSPKQGSNRAFWESKVGRLSPALPGRT